MKIYFIMFLLITCSACNFAPGSYPYAEEYELKYPESEVANAIILFKKNNPQYIVPEVTINNSSFSLKDQQDQATKDRFMWYFYCKDDDQILLTSTRSLGKSRTGFALITITNRLDIRKWKDINKDLNASENKAVKEKFKNEILEQLKKYLQHH